MGFEIQEGFPGLGGKWVLKVASSTTSTFWVSWKTQYNEMEVGEQVCVFLSSSWEAFGEANEAFPVSQFGFLRCWGRCAFSHG